MTWKVRCRLGASRCAAALLAGVIVALTLVGIDANPAAATSYVPVSGAGSSWSANALDAWIADVKQNGIEINYSADGSTAGREEYIQGTVDFAASDIPFQTTRDDGNPAETPPADFAYMPVTAGGTSFMYNLTINGQRVTNLRLSDEDIAKIYSGEIVSWNDPAIQADNPQLTLPDIPIVPVVRSDGSGSTAQLSLWMINQYPAEWSSLCQRAGRGANCGETSFFPTVGNMIAQNGDLGVASYVSQGFADGAIGYVEYSYALNAHFPVALMLNAAGYYEAPTPYNVAVSLLQAKVDTTDVNNPELYLTQQLNGVYTDPDPRTYPLSSYSYMIIPTALGGEFSDQKGATLAAFSYYAMCQGQQSSASLGYSPMPVNLVQDAFAEIAKIPGAVTQNLTVQGCDNPTISTSGVNELALEDPQPAACDKQGPVQCSTGTGGDAAPTTLNSPAVAGSTASSTGKPATSAASGSSSAAAAATPGAATAAAASQNASSTTTPGAAAQCNADTGDCSGASSSAGGGSSQLAASAITEPTHRGWGSTQTLMVLVGILALALILIPGLIAFYLKSGQ